MTAKPKRRRDDPKQSKRFIETAKEVEADTDEEALERALKKISSKAPTRRGVSSRDDA
jgi:hypothetical protein